MQLPGLFGATDASRRGGVRVVRRAPAALARRPGWVPAPVGSARPAPRDPAAVHTAVAWGRIRTARPV